MSCPHITSGLRCKICDPVPEKKKRKRIKPVSDKYDLELKKYHSAGPCFLKENPKCQFEGCSKKSIERHHKIGRGKELNNKKYWLAVCRDHHEWIEKNGKEAKKLGYSISRLIKHT